MALWRGHVIYTAPGDFPERLSGDFELKAPSIEAAAEALKEVGLDPVVTLIERIRPSWREVDA